MSNTDLIAEIRAEIASPGDPFTPLEELAGKAVAALEEADTTIAQQRDAIENHSVPKSIYTVTATDLVDTERERDALRSVIAEALAVRHGEFGPWDDDLCDYQEIAAILSRGISDAHD